MPAAWGNPRSTSDSDAFVVTGVWFLIIIDWLMKPDARRIQALVSKLDVFIQLRNVREGFRLVDELRKELKSGIDCNGQSIIPLALCLAQWVDLGYRDHTALESVIEKLPKRHSELSFLDVMRLNLVEAHSCLFSENLDRAIIAELSPTISPNAARVSCSGELQRQEERNRFVEGQILACTSPDSCSGSGDLS